MQSQKNLAPPTLQLITTPPWYPLRGVFHSRSQSESGGAGYWHARSRFAGLPIAMNQWGCERVQRLYAAAAAPGRPRGELRSAVCVRHACDFESCQEDACLTTFSRSLRLRCVPSPGCPSIVPRSHSPAAYTGAPHSWFGLARVPSVSTPGHGVCRSVVVLGSSRLGEGDLGDGLLSCLHIGL